MATIGLGVITREYTPELDRKLRALQAHFDTIYVQINGEQTSVTNPLADKVEFSHFKWCDDFAAARNALLEHVTTDYWMWMDTDDEVVGLEHLPAILAEMAASGADVVDLAYEYDYNDQGECTLLQWRERILKNTGDFYWKGRVHETVLAQGSDHLRVQDNRITYKHVKTRAEVDASVERNHRLLLQAWADEHDPRTAHYLGLSFFNLRQWEEAISYFLGHIETSGWPEEQYRSWLKVAESYKFLNNYKLALKACNEASDLLPRRPEAFFLKAQFLLDTDEFDAALAAVEDGRNRPFPTETLAPVDQTQLTYRPLLVGALAMLNLGKIREAWSWFRAAQQLSPNFGMIKELKPLFESLYGEDLAVERINWLSRYLKATKGSAAKLFEALPPSLFLDIRLNKERNSVIQPKTWPERSIVFFCGESAEAWGPDTLDKGMGGSEEAVLYLSRELAQLGWDITVFNERDEEHWDESGVHYLPWTAMNPNDQFNVFVSWRRPTLFSAFPIKAKRKLVDLHDAPVGHTSIPPEAVAATDYFMFKSQFQRLLASHIPDSKVMIVPNGIVPEHFDQDVKRNPLKVVYSSTHDRGLEALLELWPQIKAQVPEAELHTYYGWNTFDALHKDNPTQMRWKWNMIRQMHRAGAIDHGRLSHTELAQELLSAGVWAYPTMFPEISCITAMKAGAAGLESVTSGYAALAETQLHGFKFGDNVGIDPIDVYKDPERQSAFVGAVVKALKRPLPQKQRDTLAKQYLTRYSWANVARGWDEAVR